jgi:hypothetical protein
VALRDGWKRHPFSGNPEELEGLVEKDIADDPTQQFNGFCGANSECLAYGFDCAQLRMLLGTPTSTELNAGRLKRGNAFGTPIGLG